MNSSKVDFKIVTGGFITSWNFNIFNYSAESLFFLLCGSKWWRAGQAIWNHGFESNPNQLVFFSPFFFFNLTNPALKFEIFTFFNYLKIFYFLKFGKLRQESVHKWPFLQKVVVLTLGWCPFKICVAVTFSSGFCQKALMNTKT